MVAALTRLGRTAEAEEAKALLLSRDPGFKVGDFVLGEATNGLVPKVRAALRDAGMPE